MKKWVAIIHCLRIFLFDRLTGAGALGMMGGQFRVPLKPLGMHIIHYYRDIRGVSGGPQSVPHDAERPSLSGCGNSTRVVRIAIKKFEACQIAEILFSKRSSTKSRGVDCKELYASF